MTRYARTVVVRMFVRLTCSNQPERAAKRSSRKDGHRDDRGRRPPEKDRDERGRDSERRRKEREVNDPEARGSLSAEKVFHSILYL